MDTISGIPAHPLFVHIPVVLLPLAALGAILLVIKASWNERYKWAVLVITGVGALGAILAAGAGESLEEAMPADERAGIHEHAEMGDTAKALAILFFIGVLAWVIVPWFLNRKAAAQQTKAVGADVPATRTGGPMWLKAVLAVIMLGTATASVVTIIDAGHSGAEKVWQEEGGDEGNDDGVSPESGDDDGD